MNDSDSFLSAGPSSECESRPRAVNPRTGKEQSWQRASNYAAPLDNPHGLIKYQLRKLITGLSLRPDLARLLLTGAVIEDNTKSDEIISQAHTAAEIEAKANNGTAVHAALSRSFLGHETPAEYLPHVNAFAAELRRNGLEPAATEVRTMYVGLGVIGHTDWVVKTADGRHLILDVKTGSIGHAGKFSVQCKAYAGAEYIDDGNGGWIPIPFDLDQTEAILAHVDPETGATALYRVDLVLGFYGATLAERVRQWGKIQVLSPYVPVHHAVPRTVDVPFVPPVSAPTTAVAAPAIPSSAVEPARVDDLGRHIQTTQSGHLVSFPPPSATVVGTIEVTEPRPASAETALQQTPHSDSTQVVRAALTPPASETEELLKPAEWAHRLGIAFHVPADLAGECFRSMSHADFLDYYGRAHIQGSNPGEPTVSAEIAAMEQHAVAPVAPSMEPAAVEAERVELMQTRNDKATLQRMAANLGCKDLAHNRLWLADWIIATRRGLGPDAAESYAKSKGTSGFGIITPENPVPTNVNPSFPGDLTFMLKSIEGAKSEGAIEALRANLVQRRGDQAWTDEMAEAARKRVIELIAASGNAVDPALRVLAQLKSATEQQQIAQLWLEVTIGGSVESNWTEAMNEAAQARMAEIQAAQSPAPANPFGPSQG